MCTFYVAAFVILRKRQRKRSEGVDTLSDGNIEAFCQQFSIWVAHRQHTVDAIVNVDQAHIDMTSEKKYSTVFG